MFYLVLELPFNITLVFKEKFFSTLSADLWKDANPLYRAFIPTPAWQVDSLKRPIWIPLKSK